MIYFISSSYQDTIMPILQMKKLKLREIKYFAEGHIVNGRIWIQMKAVYSIVRVWGPA